MTATELLKHEHQIILLMLENTEREAGRQAEPDHERVAQLVDFFRNFADHCHHAKEEHKLFPRLVDRGLSLEEGPIAVMLAEHEEGRAYVRLVAAELDKHEEADAALIVGSLLSFVELLRSHIGKEDNVLYPLADQLLSPTDQQSLLAEFEQVEREEIGEGVHERYHELAHAWPGD